MDRAKLKKHAVSLLNIVIPLLFAFGVGAIFALIIGYNPLKVYGMIIKAAFGTGGGWMQTLGFACPIIMTGIATAFAFKAGLWNIGVEGQLYIGAMAAALVGGGYYFFGDLPSFLHLPLALLMGMVFGALFALIPAMLKAYLSINEVVTTIMLNYVAIDFTTYLVKAWYQGDQSYDSTYNVMESALIPKLISKYRLTFAIFIAVLIVFIIWFVLRKTRFGYEIGAIGRQLEFSEAAGMRVKRKIIQVFLVSGAIAGIAGATEILGVNKNFTPEFSTNPGLGWQGYFVAVLAKDNPIAVLIVAIIFGGFRYGSIATQSKTGVPLDLLNIIQGALIMFFAIQYVSDNFEWFKKRREKRLAKGGEIRE